MTKNTIGITRNKINLNVTTTRRRTNARIPAFVKEELFIV
jgi:hypothetical protein